MFLIAFIVNHCNSHKNMILNGFLLTTEKKGNSLAKIEELGLIQISISGYSASKGAFFIQSRQYDEIDDWYKNKHLKRN